MPTIPVRASRVGFSTTLPAATWGIEAYKLATVRHAGGAPYNVTETPPPAQTATEWMAVMVADGAPAAMSAGGISVTPNPVMGDPDPLNFFIHVPETDFEDVNDETHAGISVSALYHASGSNYRWSGTGQVGQAGIADAVRSGLEYQIKAVAYSRNWPTPGSASNPIVKFLFDFGDEVLTTTSVSYEMTSGNFNYYKSAPVSYTAPDGDGFSVRIRALDSLGLVTNWAYANIGEAPELSARFGSCVDPATGTMFSAVNEGDGVRINRFKDGISSRESLAFIESARASSLFLKPSRVLVAGVTDRTSGEFVRLVSRDYGVSVS